jgi:hypothetical protein
MGQRDVAGFTMPGLDSPINYTQLGRCDGEEAGSSAVAALVNSDGGAAFRNEAERQLESLSSIVAAMAESGLPAAEVASYRAGWLAALDHRLDRLAAELLPLLQSMTTATKITTKADALCSSLAAKVLSLKASVPSSRPISTVTRTGTGLSSGKRRVHRAA